MPRTRVKICGITRPEDAALAAEFGADAIGMNFFAGPRRIALSRAREILLGIPPLVDPVALTSGPTADFPDAHTFDEIQAGAATAARAPLSISTFQFYGSNLLLANSATHPIDVWSVCRIAEGDIKAQIASHLATLSFRPSTLVFDAAGDGALGGTGKRLDWRALRDAWLVALQKEAFQTAILAGGLTPDNVAEAIRIARPYAVDVSSGVEVPGKPGIKDPIKMRDFIQAAQGA